MYLHYNLKSDLTSAGPSKQHYTILRSLHFLGYTDVSLLVTVHFHIIQLIFKAMLDHVVNAAFCLNDLYEQYLLLLTTMF